jgi:hypothetical protein
MSTSDIPTRVYLGFDANEIVACCVARESIIRRTPNADVHRISRLSLGAHYTRPTSCQPGTGRLWDDISDAPMSTDHAIARFFVPWLCDYTGWAIFMDGDVLCQANLDVLLAYADPAIALHCVQHPPLLAEGAKKDGAAQLAYPRKNWSSVMLFNCGHPANRQLDLHTLNSLPGRDLHRFCWLQDAEIGALDPKWNYLVNVNEPLDNPAIVHFTLGVPLLAAHAHDPYSDEWYAMAMHAGYRIGRLARQLDHAG